MQVTRQELPFEKAEDLKQKNSVCCTVDISSSGIPYNSTNNAHKGVVMQRSHDLIGSWVIVDKATGKPVIELYNTANVVRVNTDRYQVYTAEEWLGYFNKQANNA